MSAKAERVSTSTLTSSVADAFGAGHGADEAPFSNGERSSDTSVAPPGADAFSSGHDNDSTGTGMADAEETSVASLADDASSRADALGAWLPGVLWHGTAVSVSGKADCE